MGQIPSDLDADRVPNLLEVVEEHRFSGLTGSAVDRPFGNELATQHARSPVEGAGWRSLGFDAEDVAVTEQHRSGLGVTQCRSPLGDSFQHGGQVAGIGADQAQDVRRGGLQLERLGQVFVAFLDLAEESGIVDGDGSLIRERLQECDLRVGVSAGFNADEGHDADDFASASHR